MTFITVYCWFITMALLDCIVKEPMSTILAYNVSVLSAPHPLIARFICWFMFNHLRWERRTTGIKPASTAKACCCGQARY